MQVIRWNFRTLTLLMLDLDGILYCPSTSLALTLGVTANNLRHLAAYHPHVLTPLSIRSIPSKA